MKTVIQNGVAITLSNKEYHQYEQERKKKLAEAKQKIQEVDLKEFLRTNSTLNEKIINSLQNEKSIVKQKVLKTMIKKFSTKEDLEYRTWLYNDGKLRSNLEVEEYKTRRKKEMYQNSSDFNTSTKVTNTICFIVPFSLCIGIVMSKPDAKSLWFIYIPIAIFIACIFSYISMMIGCAINIKRGKRKGLSDSDPRIMKEELNFKIGVASGIATGASIVHNTKQAVKDITNVDSWKEFK